MFERFTEAARRAVTTAVEEAQRRGDTRVAAEHLLVAVLAAEVPFDRAVLAGLDCPVDELRQVLDAVDADALAAVGLDPALVASDAFDVAGRRGWPRRRHGHLPFTTSAKRALEGTLRTAVALGDRRLGPEHILLALLEHPEGDGLGAVLRALEVDPDAISARITEALRRAS